MSENNQPSVRVIEATTCNGVTLWTLVIKYHRFVHAEALRHRVYSRGVGSSRAVPVERMVARATAMPLHWGSNKPGMQAGAELTGWRLWTAKLLWKAGMVFTRRLSLTLAKLGLHKQLANRWTEPCQWVEEVITGTEWENFFTLRAHEAAQPEIAALAMTIRAVLDSHRPRLVGSGDRTNVWNWHLPFVNQVERESAAKGYYDSRGPWYNCLYLAKLSAARCARASYFNHDGSNPSHVKDLALFDKLREDPKVLHASPSEHQAYPMPAPWQWSRNLRGFRQHRELLEGPGYDE